VILFVRHGETERNRAGGFQGRSDLGLTATGRAAVAALARRLRAESPAAVVTSPLRRAVESAKILASECALDVEVDDRLVELDYGEWEGRPLADVGADEWRRWQDDPAFAPPGGERLADVGARIAVFCSERAPGEQRVVAVSHVSPIKAAAAWALGAPDAIAFRCHLDLASVTRVASRGGRGLLLSFNETVRDPGR
jgi:broad specificity phosphatase PhoE